MNTKTRPLETLLATLSQVAANASPTSLALATCPPPGTRLPAPLPEPLEPSVTVSPPVPPILKGRPRTGAVASLPKDQRDMVCRMIAGGVPYKRIAEALDQLGFQITERNVSNWVTHGGYAEWSALYNDALQTTLRQDDLLEHHRNENSPDLAEVGLQAAAVRLSELLLRQTAANHDVESNFSRLEPVVNLLCRINKELFTLQKYRDDCQAKIYRTPARIKAKERDQLVQIEKLYSPEPPTPKSPNTPLPSLDGSPATPAAPAIPPTEQFTAVGIAQPAPVGGLSAEPQAASPSQPPPPESSK